MPSSFGMLGFSTFKDGDFYTETLDSVVYVGRASFCVSAFRSRLNQRAEHMQGAFFNRFAALDSFPPQGLIPSDWAWSSTEESL